MLTKALLRIAALHIVKAARVAAVVPAENAAFGIDLRSERVAAPFSKDFVLALLWMIAPDELAERMRYFLLTRPANISRHRAALPTVEPTVGPPAETVGDGMRILDAKAFEMHFGVAVGYVVVILVWVKEQIGRIK